MEEGRLAVVVKRINELTRISRERTLTAAEQEERAGLRGEYAAAFRQSLQSQLDNTYVLGEDGVKRKLEKKQPG